MWYTCVQATYTQQILLQPLKQAALIVEHTHVLTDRPSNNKYNSEKMRAIRNLIQIDHVATYAK